MKLSYSILSILYILCSFLVQSVGAQEALELDGALKVANATGNEPGTIRWTGTDFEGRTDSEWKSLTVPALTNPNQVVDIDGNVYNTIAIGTQTWMRENLRTSRYNDGTAIPDVTFEADWITDNPALSSFQNNTSFDREQGKLYNWFAVDLITTSGKNVCPSGWRVPFNSDLTALASFLGGEAVAGEKLKESGPVHWGNSNTATNESGFTGLAVGIRTTSGAFDNSGFFAPFWSQSENTATHGVLFLLTNSDDLEISNDDKNWGFSVRCIKN